jgi:hypothetical protein
MDTPLLFASRLQYDLEAKEIGIHFWVALSIVFEGLSFVKLIRYNWRIALMPFSGSP